MKLASLSILLIYIRVMMDAIALETPATDSLIHFSTDEGKRHCCHVDLCWVCLPH